jgi:uncharacterized protein
MQRLAGFLGQMMLLACLSLAAPVWAQDVQKLPPLSGRVIDQTATLSETQRAALDAKLAAYEQAAGPQIVILMVATSQPEDITTFAQRVGEAWKIGRREVGDGLLIVVAKNDRRVRIEVAKALEGAVPDLAARQIIQNAITPAFKAGDYAAGLSLGIDQLQARIRGEDLPVPQAKSGRAAADQGLGLEQIAALFFIGVPILGGILSAIFGRKLGSALTGGAAGALGWFLASSLIIAGVAGVASLLLVGVMGVGSGRRSGGLGALLGPAALGGSLGGLGGLGGGGWGGGSGGGGGFSSGGGGDFGGGGASGDW